MLESQKHPKLIWLKAWKENDVLDKRQDYFQRRASVFKFCPTFFLRVLESGIYHIFTELKFKKTIFLIKCERFYRRRASK